MSNFSKPIFLLLTLFLLLFCLGQVNYGFRSSSFRSNSSCYYGFIPNNLSSYVGFYHVQDIVGESKICFVENCSTNVNIVKFGARAKMVPEEKRYFIPLASYKAVLNELWPPHKNKINGNKIIHYHISAFANVSGSNVAEDGYLKGVMAFVGCGSDVVSKHRV